MQVCKECLYELVDAPRYRGVVFGVCERCGKTRYCVFWDDVLTQKKERKIEIVGLEASVGELKECAIQVSRFLYVSSETETRAGRFLSLSLARLRDVAERGRVVLERLSREEERV